MQNKIPYEIYKDLLGKPFKYMARGPDEYDCLGLCYELYRRLNLKLPYTESVVDRKLRSVSLEKHRSMFVQLQDVQPGCIVAIRVAGFVAHIGVALDSIKFIHAERNKRVCVEKITDLKYKKRIEGFFIFRENINE